jgi:rod shape-determining protein MreC
MVGVLAVQTSDAVREGIGISRRSMDGATAEVAKFSSGIGAWSIGFGRNKDDEAKIAKLEAEVRDLARWKDLAETMTLRMARYEKMLNIVGETQGPAVTARVVAEERGPFAATRIANAGSANGVREGFAAVNEYGLVGRVVRVGEYTSRILLVTDFNSRIPVMGSRSGDRALLVGDSASGARLLEPETPERIVPGEMWVTSGDDGQMPLGVNVGRARLEKGEWRIDLTMNDAPVDYVRLVPPPDFAKPEAAPSIDFKNGPSPNKADGHVSAVSPNLSAGPKPPAAAPKPGAKPAATPASAPAASQPAPTTPAEQGEDH